MTQRRHGGGERGQAALEVLALLPALVVAILLVWQLAVLTRGAILAHERARALALPGAGLVRETLRVPAIVPGVRGLRIPVRAEVRAP